MKPYTKELTAGMLIGVLICITASLITVATYDESKLPPHLKSVNFFQPQAVSNESAANEKSKAFCGDNICGASENCMACENDCGKCINTVSSNTTPGEPEKTNASDNNTNNIPNNAQDNPSNNAHSNASNKLTCPPSCDDKNPCTEDLCGQETGFVCVHKALSGEKSGCSGTAGTCLTYSCSEGSCIKSKTTPCEGNEICEQGESLKSADCWYCPKGYSQCINCKRICPYNIFVK